MRCGFHASRASVGTTGNADADPLVAETVADEHRFDRADEIVLDPLGLAQREAARRQRRAGERPARDRREIACQPYPVPAQYQLDGWAVRLGDVGKKNVLLRRQDRRRLVARDRFAQGGSQAHGAFVLDTAAGDRNAEIPAPVALRVPSEMVDDPEPRHRPGLRERPAEIGFERLLDPCRAARIDQVFQSRMLAIGAIAMIALQSHDRLDRREQVVGSDERDRRGQARVGIRIAVRHAEAAAQRQIVAEQLAVLE